MESQNNQRHPGPAGENISMSAKKERKTIKATFQNPGGKNSGGTGKRGDRANASDGGR